MHSPAVIAFLAAAGSFYVQSAMAQTPPNTSPATDDNLAVTYGTTRVTPGIRLPAELTSTIPTFSHTSPSTSQTYLLLLVDLSIKASQLNTSKLTPGVQLPLAAGVSSDRTTRLHYWQSGIQFGANGSLINTTEPVAFYQGPRPPPGDIAHTYAFYLFEQGAAFRPPPAGNPFSQALINEGMNRMSFSVERLSQEQGVGDLVGANYILVQNPNQASSSSASAGPSASASVSATGTGAGAGTGTSSSLPTASPFTGAAAGMMSPTASFVGGVVTVLAVSAVAMIWSF